MWHGSGGDRGRRGCDTSPCAGLRANERDWEADVEWESAGHALDLSRTRSRALSRPPDHGAGILEFGEGGNGVLLICLIGPRRDKWRGEAQEQDHPAARQTQVEASSRHFSERATSDCPAR